MLCCKITSLDSRIRKLIEVYSFDPNYSKLLFCMISSRKRPFRIPNNHSTVESMSIKESLKSKQASSFGWPSFSSRRSIHRKIAEDLICRGDVLTKLKFYLKIVFFRIPSHCSRWPKPVEKHFLLIDSPMTGFPKGWFTDPANAKPLQLLALIFRGDGYRDLKEVTTSKRSGTTGL